MCVAPDPARSGLAHAHHAQELDTSTTPARLRTSMAFAPPWSSSRAQLTIMPAAATTARQIHARTHERAPDPVCASPILLFARPRRPASSARLPTPRLCSTMPSARAAERPLRPGEQPRAAPMPGQREEKACHRQRRAGFVHWCSSAIAEGGVVGVCACVARVSCSGRSGRERHGAESRI
ncbi:hypothetical protein ZWY2020_053869 [Hordeum vulgare]|nr:hypothetical protein ZWY2020_040682 [Hordeum vulgare]KAI4998527.1 hypothetical protein ZWY2020_053869 [Hordeum vulgare]